jgi:outer membrane protein TolC
VGRAGILLLAWVPLALSACRAPTQQAADAEAYGALAARRPCVPEALGSLDVEAAECAARLARRGGDVTLDLAGALALAARASREYRAKREDAVLAALALSDARHAFRANPAAGLTSDLETDGTTTGESHPYASVTKAFETGGSLVLKLAQDFLKAFTGDPLSTARTILSADLTLPLGRGAGPLVAREPLTQAERDVLYSLRDFARYQQEFYVRVVTGYFRALQQGDVVENERRTEASIERLFDRAKEFGPEGAGRIADFEVDRARQDLLRARDRRVRAEEAREAALDRLKLDLGLPPDTRLVLDADVVRRLVETGPDAALPSVEQEVATGRARRLDLKNARDRSDDAVRRVAVAEDALKADVTLRLGGDVSTPERSPLALRRATTTGRAGLDVDLPADRILERNALRAARIDADRARRDAEGIEDQVVADVRQAARTLEQAKSSYAIQAEGVRVAERRVESANLFFERSRATTRDVLEAEDSRVQAKNALTAAAVDYAVAKMELERDAGTLRPDAIAFSGSCAPPPPSPAKP